MKNNENKRARNTGDSNKTRVLSNANEKYLYHSIVDDLLIPLLNASKILEGSPPRSSKQNEVRLIEKYKYVQKKIRDARSEVQSGLNRWNEKYEKPIQEHLAKLQILAAEDKLINLKKSSTKKNKTDQRCAKPRKSTNKNSKPTKPEKIKLNKELLLALEQLQDYFDR